ncbi:MAG: hypothetical protein ACRDFB_01295, partial [Rhabdochlamydiaceae bacterium]
KESQINNLQAYLYIAARNRVLRIFEKGKFFVPFEYLIDSNTQCLNGETTDFLALQNEFLQAYKALLDSLPSQRRKIFDCFYDE